MKAKTPSPTLLDATHLKMGLGSIGKRVLSEDIQITKHGTPQAVIISPDRYAQLTRLEPINPASLGALDQAFEARLDRMQGGKQAAAMDWLMHADEDEITRKLAQHYSRQPIAVTAARPDASHAVVRKAASRSSDLDGISPVSKRFKDGELVIRKSVTVKRDRNGKVVPPVSKPVSAASKKRSA